MGEKRVVKFSVIIPVYKDKDIAKNAILSLARQFRSKDDDWAIECVIVMIVQMLICHH